MAINSHQILNMSKFIAFYNFFFETEYGDGEYIINDLFGHVT